MESKNRYVLPLTTIALLLLASLCYQESADTEILSHWGSYISGVAAALAFLWLVAGFYQQSKELRMQREELALQRQTLENQRKELTRISKYNALQQISGMLDGFASSLPREKLPAVTTVDQLSVAFMTGVANHWKVILESNDSQEVFTAHRHWLPIESLCTEFISTYWAAMKLYSEATGEILPIQDENASQYIYFNYEHIRTIPHLQKYSGAAFAIATDLFLMDPGLTRVRFAGYSALNKIYPNIVKQDALEKLKSAVDELDKKDNQKKE